MGGSLASQPPHSYTTRVVQYAMQGNARALESNGDYIQRILLTLRNISLRILVSEAIPVVSGCKV